jgi:hypothetical protein
VVLATAGRGTPQANGWVSGIAIEKLPDSVPEFIRAPEAAAEMAVMSRELDRSKGAGKTDDAERDPAGWPRRSKRSAARPASTLRRASSEIFSV